MRLLHKTATELRQATLARTAIGSNSDDRVDSRKGHTAKAQCSQAQGMAMGLDMVNRPLQSQTHSQRK